MIDQAKIHRKTLSDEVEVRREAVEQLSSNFSVLKDRKDAWADLIRLTGDENHYVRWGATEALGAAFPHVLDKEDAWADLHRLTGDENYYVRWEAIKALGAAFPHIPDKEDAWTDLIRLTGDKNNSVRRKATEALGAAFPHVSGKKQVWADLIRLTGDWDDYVRRKAIEALGAAFPHVPDKTKAWVDLIRLTGDTNSFVRVSANHASGRVSIFKATEAETEDEFRKEIETAILFFEESSREAATDSNPSRFCLPFYRSFYTITSENQEAEAEVQNYLTEAKRAAEGSESKEKLLEAVENLANALKEVQNLRGMDFDVIKRDLNAYRRYCERAAELLEVTEEQAPGATKLIKRGLPIIDQKIKEILGKIQEKTAEVCRETKGTSLEPLGYEINLIGKSLLLVRDPIGLEKQVAVMEVIISSICDKMSQDEREEACELLKIAKLEPHAEDKLPWFNTILSKIPAQIRTMGLEKKIDALIVSLKPGIREELTVTVGAEVFGTGVQHVITIPLQEISYPELKEDLAKIKEKSTNKLASLPQRLAHKVKDYLIRTKKEDLLKQLR